MQVFGDFSRGNACTLQSGIDKSQLRCDNRPSACHAMQLAAHRIKLSVVERALRSLTTRMLDTEVLNHVDIKIIHHRAKHVSLYS